MIVLGLDTTTRAGSVAVLRDDKLLAVATGEAAHGHAERLPAALVAVMERAGIRLADVDVFAVAAGPGSFTGLRIGIATVQGLAFALDRPVVAVSVLDALAVVAGGAEDSARGGPVEPGATAASLAAAWMDAQRGEVFAALYRGDADLDPIDGPVSEAPGRLLDRWRELAPDRTIRFAGDGVSRYHDLLVQHLGSRFLAVEPAPPLAPTIARLAAAEAAAGRAVSPHAVRPLYVRKPDAELARERDGKAPASPDAADERRRG